MLQKTQNNSIVNSTQHLEKLEKDRQLATFDKMQAKPIMYTGIGSALQDCIEQGKTTAIAKRVVFKLAYTMDSRYCGEACRQLADSYFTEEIMQDVVNAVNLCFSQGLDNGGIWLDYNSTVAGIEMSIHYDSYTNTAGTEKGYYSQFYNAVEAAFYRYNGRKSVKPQEIGYIQGADGYKWYEATEKVLRVDKATGAVYEEEVKTGRMHAQYKAGASIWYDSKGNRRDSREEATAGYMSSLAEEGSEDMINAVIARQDFKYFMQAVKNRVTEKNYSILCKYITGRMQGKTAAEISKMYKLSKSQVQHAAEDLKALYNGTYYEKKEEKKKEVNRKYASVKVSAAPADMRIDCRTYGRSCEAPIVASGKALGHYDKKQAKEDRKKKQEGGRLVYVVTYSEGAVKAVEVYDRRHNIQLGYYIPVKYQVKQEAPARQEKGQQAAKVYRSIEDRQKAQQKALKKAWKASKVRTSKEEGQQAAQLYTIRQAWREAIPENIRRQAAWEDYTRTLAFSQQEAGAKEYRQENGFISVYIDGVKVRQYPIAGRKQATTK